MGKENASVSAQDVASLAGVSRTTVSFVLNNTPGKNISESTRRKVREVADALGYRPNEDARKLAMSRDRSFGLFICHNQPVYTDMFLTRVLEGMSQAVNRLRVRLVVHPTQFRETSYLELARRDAVDGIILINVHDDDPALIELVDERFPAVSMDFVGDLGIDQVYIDNVAAARQTVQHLIDLGHRRIGMIAHADPLYLASRTRIIGYEEALETANIEVADAWLRTGDFSEQSGYREMQELLKADPPISAVFAGNDVIAYGAMQAIYDAGKRVPDDISLVGFDDNYMSRFLKPALTTMAVPATGYGSTAVETLMDRLARPESPLPIHRVLKSDIVIRETTRSL